MFCPKCGIENPDNGKFCRKCGTDLSGISKALNNEGDNSFDGMNCTDPLGLGIAAVQSGESQGKRDDPIDLWSAGIRNTIFGSGFLVVALVLFLTHVAQGQRWWWAMLIPGFSMIAGGVSNLVKAKQLEKRMADSANAVQQSQLSGNQQTASLPPKQTEYVSPDMSKYQTGDLVPKSVIENTTRHLEMDSEGETMTLKKK